MAVATFSGIMREPLWQRDLLLLNLIASVVFSDDPLTLFPTLGTCLSVFGADVGEITR